MTAASQNPLVERATTAVIESERTKYPMQRFIARRFAQAALDACHAEEILEALRSVTDTAECLVGGMSPDCAEVLSVRRAEALLAKLDGRS